MAADLRTARLFLRRWRDEDRAPFAALNADPVVMEHFPAPLERGESDALVEAIGAHFDEHGYGLWALERRDDGAFLGFAGLNTVGFEAHFTPAVEVGWRLARGAWGHGYASEAGAAALHRGLREVDRVVSFTATSNTRSEAVMRRLGMRRSGTFEHPMVPEGDRLRRHVLYVAHRRAGAVRDRL